MNFDKLREYPVVGDTIFAEPVGGLYNWLFVAFSVLYTLSMLIDRGYKVGLLAGGGLFVLSVPNVLSERHYRLCVVLRIVGIVYYIALWLAIFIFFPDAPTFFEGNW